MSTAEPWWALYYRHMSLETERFATVEIERFATERDAVMFLHELDYGSPVAVHGPNDYKLGQGDISRRARQFWEAENPDAAEAERRADEERKRQQQARQARYEAWLAEQPDWYRAEVSSIQLTPVDGLHRVEVNGEPLPFRVRAVELQHDETTYGPDRVDMPALVLHLDYAASASIEYGNAETRKAPQ